MTAASTDAVAPETRPFAADVAQLLKLMVHSVYSNRDVFLRELVSNAADACEKLRYRALTEPGLVADDGGFRILIEVDPDGRTLTISDNGVGMSREELAENLGTIARSGTRAFVEALERDKGESGATLIGQFGVGFYSAFMVAKEVSVTSRAAGAADAWTWTSDGSGTFSIAPAGENAPARGTRVVLRLLDDAADYANEATVERIIEAHAAHVPVPVEIRQEGSDTGRVIVDGSALWTKPKNAVTPAEYREFYETLTGDPSDPALTLHYRAEGRHDYSVLAFVPERPPFDLFDPERRGRVKLYVRRVFISDDAKVLPGWLRFVRGIVDSEDLPLNLSREMLQANPLLKAIRKGVTNRILGELEKLAENDRERYLKIWEAFGAVLKEGLYEEPDRRDALLKLARFRTTADPAGWRSLAEVVAGLKQNQTSIYYALGDSLEALKASPHLEGYRARGVEVLLLTDPVDAFWIQTALGYDGKPFRSVTQGKSDLDQIPLETPADEGEAAKPGDLAVLVALLKQTLESEVADVRPSGRLAESACCLVAADFGPDRRFEKMLRATGNTRPLSKPVMEINGRHPLVRALAERAAAGGGAAAIEDAAHLLLDEARILDGELPADPAAFATRLSRVLEKAVKG